jgi:hypothetical protein
MCRRRKRDWPTRHEFLPKKLAAHRATHGSAIWRQRSHPLSSLPATSRQGSLEGARIAARAAVGPGAHGIFGSARRRRNEIPARSEPGLRGNSRPASGAVLLRRAFWLAFLAVAHRWRYFADSDGVANEPQQSGSGAGEFGGSDHGLHFPGTTGCVWFALGARCAERREPEDIFCRRRGRRRRRVYRCDRGCGVSRAPIFNSHATEIRAPAASVEIYFATAERDVARSEHERDRASHVYFSECAARRSVRIASAVPCVAFRVAAGEIISGCTRYAGRHRRTRSGPGGAAAAIWRARRVGRGRRAGMGCGCRRRSDCRRNFCAGYGKFVESTRDIAL